MFNHKIIYIFDDAYLLALILSQTFQQPNFKNNETWSHLLQNSHMAQKGRFFDIFESTVPADIPLFQKSTNPVDFPLNIRYNAIPNVGVSKSTIGIARIPRSHPNLIIKPINLYINLHKF